MFSSGGASPQFAGLFYEVSSTFNRIKKRTVIQPVTFAQWKYRHSKKQQTETILNNEDSSDPPQVKHPCSQMFEELGFTFLPLDWRDRLTSPLSIYPVPEKCESHWSTSHISANSFFQNKHGFPNLLSINIGPSRLKCSVFPWSCSRPPWLNSALTVQKRWLHSSQLSVRQIQQLEEKANDEPDNPFAQTEYLKAMVREDPDYVIRRYESGNYASNEATRKEYLKALMLTERTSLTEMEQLANTGQADMFAGRAALKRIASGAEDSPVHVVMQSPKGAFFKEQLWNTIRFLIGLFLILSVIEAQLQMKMTTNQKEILPDNSEKKCKFSDVQGVEEAKQELQEVVEFLRNPDKFKRLGGKLPTGVLLIGPPGTGKTLLAKAVAGEAGVPFFFCSGSEFDEMFVGVGAARVRNLFAAAREHAPCIVFVDELDAIGGTRIVHDHQPYSRMTLNQLLVELDGFDKSEGIVVIGATNFPEILDKALVRPGRFDTKITVTMPDVKARYEILKVHLKNVTVADEVDVHVLARGTPGFSGADLANLVNQAAIRAAADGDPAVSLKHLEFAKDKIIMGPERKSAVIEAQNRELVAWHEGGHAIVALNTPGAQPVHKATIVPRGQALGMVAQLPEKDELNWSKKQLLAKLDVCMGGRVAEELIFGKENITTGASSDSEQATQIARKMVTSFAMSDKVGMVSHKDDDKMSPELQSLIENEVRQLITDAYERAKSILQSHSKEHRRLAEGLLRYETLTADEIQLVIKGKPLARVL